MKRHLQFDYEMLVKQLVIDYTAGRKDYQKAALMTSQWNQKNTPVVVVIVQCAANPALLHSQEHHVIW